MFCEMDLGHDTNEYVSVSQVKEATNVITHAIENILERPVP
jgi:acetylornithine deacetylase/succinyl-diaminopimelate desuccinylase-like protein